MSVIKNKYQKIITRQVITLKKQNKLKRGKLQQDLKL
jgi:hypothetical protein